MLSQADASGTTRTLTQIWQADASGTPRQLQQLWQAGADGTPRQIYSAASLVVNPNAANAYIASKGSSSGYTNSVTVSGYSGTPNSIVWTVPTGWSVVNQGNATTNFKSPSLAAGDEADGDGSVAVTFGGMTQTTGFSLYASNGGLS